MFYSKTMSIPPDTRPDNPIEETIALSHGVITKAIFRPRPGHASLLHVKVYHGRHQIFPSSGDDDLHGDWQMVEWDEWYEINQKPFFLTISAWNDSQRYAHTFDFAVAQLPKYAVLPFAMMRAIDDLVRALSPKRISIPTWLGGKKG